MSSIQNRILKLDKKQGKTLTRLGALIFVASIAGSVLLEDKYYLAAISAGIGAIMVWFGNATQTGRIREADEREAMVTAKADAKAWRLLDLAMSFWVILLILTPNDANNPIKDLGIERILVLIFPVIAYFVANLTRYFYARKLISTNINQPEILVSKEN